MDKEIWKDITGYEGIYQASTFGRIRTVDSKQTYSIKHGIRTWKSRILKYRGHNPITGNRVTLWKDKKSKDFLVARLIGFTFLGIPEDKSMTINHKDGNRFNNCIENLEWLSLADNIRHAFETGLMPTQKHTCLIGKEGQVYEFRSMSKASKWLGFRENYISGVIKKNGKIYDKQGNIYKLA